MTTTKNTRHSQKNNPIVSYLIVPDLSALTRLDCELQYKNFADSPSG